MTKARVFFDVDLSAYPHLNSADDLRRAVVQSMLEPSMRAAQEEFHAVRTADRDGDQKAVALAGHLLGIKLITAAQQGLTVDMIPPDQD